jgi:hypothetical protein
VEGEEVIQDLDLPTLAGKSVAHDYDHLVNVTDGVLNITLRPEHGNAKVCGILIQPVN